MIQLFRQYLPPYKRPRRFEIAYDLPRTATGKVQRNKLREQLRRDPHCLDQNRCR